MPASRVVSLVPSVTETLMAWGVEPVACTRFCEQPGLRHVGGTKDPDVTAIVGLDPDLVVVDREENRREDAEALQAAGIHTHVLQVRGLGDLDEQMGQLAEAVGGEWEPLGNVEAEATATTSTAYVPIWRRPWMALGEPTYGSSVLRALGIGNVANGEPYPNLTPSVAKARGADLVIAPSEPYPFKERHRGQLEEAGPVVFVDGQDLLWWGARTRRAIERLRAQLG
jgi:ABC-type Fe3+-hydroxamate transport system substrate-binding protein